MTSAAASHDRPLRSHAQGRTTARLALERAAQDGELKTDDWPPTLQYILSRLDEIVDEFPKPTHGPSEPQPQLLSSQDSQAAADKENAPPTTPTRPPVPAFAAPESQSLPPDVVNFYSSIRTALSRNFAKNPPHTIQRLAELILEPKRRYAFLPPYLRALDRVVSVSSPTTIFPLPQAVLPTAGAGLLNGTTSTPSSTLGSDESLGGALLTPIPWLQNRGQSELISESTEIVDGPHGAGRIETVTVVNGNGNGTLSASPSPTTPTLSSSPFSSTGGVAQIASSHPDGETLPATGAVTQGEILRQEQEAGIVLSNPHTIHPGRPTMGEFDGAASILDTIEPEDEVPHARGPEIIGLEDTGLQKESTGLDFEGAVGRTSTDGARASKSPAPAAKEAGEAMDESGDGKDGEAGDKQAKDDEMKTDE